MRLLALVCVLFASTAFAQTFPTKPIRMVVAFPPGGSTDLAARALGEKLATALGQPVVIDNKPGASGNIGADFVAKSAADGHTLLMAATSFVTAPAFFPKLGWHPSKDFAPVSLVATVPIIVVVHPSLPVYNPRDLIAYSKANAGKLNLASPGAATLTRLSGEMFKQAAGVDWVTVHYKGGPPAVADLLGGQSHVMFANISDVITQVKAGRLRALAVTSARRTPALPDVPTLDESGLTGLDVSQWWGVFVPAGAPRNVISRLYAEIVKIIKLPNVASRMADLGAEPVGSSPEQLRELLRKEIAKYRKIVKETNVRID